MSPNKQIVTQYMDSYAANNDSAIEAILADNVIWEMPGFFSLTGKTAFMREKHNPAAAGLTHIQVSRLTEENNVVVAEGTVQSAKTGGGWLHGVFCDVFEIDNGKIRKLISYFMEIQPPNDPAI